MTRRRIALWSSALAVVILLAGAVGISNNDQHIITPEITASPFVKLHEPEPTITADSGAKIPSEPEPVVQTKHTDPVPSLSSPTNIPPRFLTPIQPPQVPYYQAPDTSATVPLPAPQQPPVAPILPSPEQPLPPVISKPVEGLTEPLKPIIKPLVPPILNPIIDPLLK